MTTANWSTVLDQSTDAAFRAHGSELSARFAAVGMIQTADTGQINWTTVVRAASNTAAGYEIWKLSSGNLYFKIEYGSGGSNIIPSCWITVGTGSNGTGSLTGQQSTRSQVGDVSTAVTSTVTNYQSYLCATANYFGLAWKLGSSATVGRARTVLLAMQTVDSTGAATSIGYEVFFNTGATMFSQCAATTAAVTGVVPTFTNFCLCPNLTGLPASSLDGAGNNQAFLWWFSILGTTPMIPVLHAASVLITDLAIGTTASMTLVGTTAHTYISAGLGRTLDPSGQVLTPGGAGIVMLWE